MYKAIAFINLKGGVAKSTSAVHLCRYLLSKQKTVALVDTDSQATSSTWINTLAESIPRPRVYRITDPDPLLDAVPGMIENFDHVVIDGAGGLAEVQRAILFLSDLVLIPIQPSFPDIAASNEAIAAVRRVRKLRDNRPDARTFLTRVLRNTLLLKEAKEALSTYRDVPLLASQIPQRQIGADVMGQNTTLFDLKSEPASELANCYRELFKEVALG
jgi:chromosome partitioning protein